MASKNKKDTRTIKPTRPVRKISTAQIFFLVFSVLLILSMLLAAFTKF
jgi:hypothetical protein